MELADLWKQYAPPGSDLEEIRALLERTNSMPEVRIKADAPWRGGGYSREGNYLELNPISYMDQQNVINHELTHALNYKMSEKSRELSDRKYNKHEKLTPAEDRFLESKGLLDSDLLRLKRESYGGPSPSWQYNSYNDYRHSNTEAPAFAVGNMNSQRESVKPGGSHVDATLATQQAIMRDLYRRSLEPEPTMWQTLQQMFRK